MINWGILGLGRMGLTFANAIEETNNSKLVSIASKSGKKFKNFKNQSYEKLIQDKNIDAIYISTLNNTHVDLIKEIIKEKKKILCEKPVSLSLENLIEVNSLINKKKIQFYEAIAYYSHPQTIALLNLLEKDEIGEIQSVESTFGFRARFNPNSRLFNKNLGGGSIFDLGCYPISFFMLLAKNLEKISIKSKILSYAKSGVDNDSKLSLDYDNKFIGNLHVSIKSNLDNCCIIKGSNGYIKINNPWLPNNTSDIEVLSNEHFYLKSTKSKLSIFANQIQNVSDSFINPEKKMNLFDITKSMINMNLISNWLKK